MKNKFEYNLNDYIYFKLKAAGWRVWVDYINYWNGLTKQPAVTINQLKELQLTSDGYCSMQLHSFMHVFGDKLHSELMEMIIYFDKPKDQP
jgi:hypothetical protein